MKKVMKRGAGLCAGALVLGNTATNGICAPPNVTVAELATVSRKYDSGNVAGRFGLGYLSGEAKEYVYYRNGAALSELDWTLDNILMVNAGVTVQVTSQFRINADIWVAANDGDGTMDDYDWLFSGNEWSDWSYHNDVPLDKGYRVDVNGEIPFYIKKGATLSGYVGVQHETWAWDAYGGKYIYSIDGFRDSYGYFKSGVHSIGYEQNWTAPYIGLGVKGEFSRLELAGRLLFSPYVFADANDTHYLRGLYYDQNFDHSTMWRLDFSMLYHVTPEVALTGAVIYQVYEEAKGRETITNRSNGVAYTSYADAVGADNETLTISAGLSYSF